MFNSDTYEICFDCEKCRARYTFVCNELEGHKTNEEIFCPDCHALLGEARCDMSAPRCIDKKPLT